MVKVDSPVLGFDMGAMCDSPPHDGLLRAAAHAALLFDDCVLLVKWQGGRVGRSGGRSGGWVVSGGLTNQRSVRIARHSLERTGLSGCAGPDTRPQPFAYVDTPLLTGFMERRLPPLISSKRGPHVQSGP